MRLPRPYDERHSRLPRGVRGMEVTRDLIRSRSALRVSHAAEEPRLFGGYGADAGPRNWCECGHLQRGLWRFAEAVALPAAGATRARFRRSSWDERAGCGHVRAGTLGFA